MISEDIWPEPEPADDDWPEPEPADDDWPTPESETDTSDPIDILDQPAGTPGPLDCGCDAAMVIITGEHLCTCEMRHA